MEAQAVRDRNKELSEILSQALTNAGQMVENFYRLLENAKAKPEDTRYATSMLPGSIAMADKVKDCIELHSEGKYGICRACSQSISIERLRGLCFAELCKKCDEARIFARVRNQASKISCEPLRLPGL